MYPVVHVEQLTPVTRLYEMLAPDIARVVRPGQFVILRLHERGERIPLTVADFDRERGTLALVVQEVGKTTMEMGAWQSIEGQR
jgi:NAD(P)H-flavin reductase